MGRSRRGRVRQLTGQQPPARADVADGGLFGVTPIDIAIWIVVAAVLLTAILTGMGALPFLFVKKTMGWLNATAAGLMLAASHGLIAEGVSIDITLTLVGVLAELGAIVMADGLLSGARGAKVTGLQGAGLAALLAVPPSRRTRTR